jgi:hypothetical protein
MDEMLVGAIVVVLSLLTIVGVVKALAAGD